MENYLGSQQHWEDGINAYYDERDRYYKSQEQLQQEDNRIEYECVECKGECGWQYQSTEGISVEICPNCNGSGIEPTSKVQ